MAYTVVDALTLKIVADMASRVPAGTFVSDNMPITDDASDRLIIGVQDEMSTDWQQLSQSQLSRTAYGTSRREDGVLNGVAECWTGADLAAARTGVLALCQALSDYLMADKTVGGLVLESLFGADLSMEAKQVGEGPVVRVLFTISFIARTE